MAVNGSLTSWWALEHNELWPELAGLFTKDKPQMLQHRGPVQFINSCGLSAFVRRAKELAAAHGERFEPPQLLIDMAAKGESF